MRRKVGGQIKREKEGYVNIGLIFPSIKIMPIASGCYCFLNVIIGFFQIHASGLFVCCVCMCVYVCFKDNKK